MINSSKYTPCQFYNDCKHGHRRTYKVLDRYDQAWNQTRSQICRLATDEKITSRRVPGLLDALRNGHLISIYGAHASLMNDSDVDAHQS